MARTSNYEPYEERQARLRAESDDRIARMRATGYTESGDRITGWSDSRTPITAFKNGLSGGIDLTPKSVWDATFRNRFADDVQRPSLTTLAAGGMNSAQRWSATVTPPASLNQFSTTPADARGIAAQYGDSGAKTIFDNTPGTRQPFIAGANGINVGPSIAAKVSANAPTLDRSYVNRASGVPNLLSRIPDTDKRPEWMRQFSWSSAFNR